MSRSESESEAYWAGDWAAAGVEVGERDAEGSSKRLMVEDRYVGGMGYREIECTWEVRSVSRTMD